MTRLLRTVALLLAFSCLTFGSLRAVRLKSSRRRRIVPGAHRRSAAILWLVSVRWGNLCAGLEHVGAPLRMTERSAWNQSPGGTRFTVEMPRHLRPPVSLFMHHNAGIRTGPSAQSRVLLAGGASVKKRAPTWRPKALGDQPERARRIAGGWQTCMRRARIIFLSLLPTLSALRGGSNPTDPGVHTF